MCVITDRSRIIPRALAVAVGARMVRVHHVALTVLACIACQNGALAFRCPTYRPPSSAVMMENSVPTPSFQRAQVKCSSDDATDEDPSAQIIYAEERNTKTSAALAAASWGAWRMQPPSNATVRARHILVNDEDKAVALLKELAFGAEIEELAAEHSLCPSRAKGGDLGVFRRGDMAEEFEAFVFDESSPIGTPLGPVRTPFGYHVVVIDERTTSHDDDRLS